MRLNCLGKFYRVSSKIIAKREDLVDDGYLV